MTRTSRVSKPTLRLTKPRFDFVLLTIILTLLTLGLIMVYDASIVEAQQVFFDKTHFIAQQLRWASLGLVLLAAAALTPLPAIKKYAPHAFFATVFLLALVIIPGLGTQVQGARRWLTLGGFTLQPSELAKLTFLVYLAVMFEKKQNHRIFLASLVFIVILVMLQPDLGTAIVITSSALSTYFLSGAPLLHFLAISSSGAIAALILIISSPYRRDRLATFLDPSRDPLGASYHIRQVLLALGSGGLLGTGIGRSLQKYQYLPEATTDSIFAVIAEETGFAGTLFVVGLFIWLSYRGFKIAASQQDHFRSLLAASLTLLISIQALLNLGAMSALVPLTGVPLPFISYGGSSLLVMLMASGLLLNISRYSHV